MWLPNAIVSDVMDVCEVFYLHWDQCKHFNERRKDGEPMVFTGWYWAKGAQEAGPFKTRSACYRDAWFRLVRHQAPPMISRRMKHKANVIAFTPKGERVAA